MRLSASLPGSLSVPERLQRLPGMETCGAAAVGNSQALCSRGTEGPQKSTNALWLHQVGGKQGDFSVGFRENDSLLALFKQTQEESLTYVRKGETFS